MSANKLEGEMEDLFGDEQDKIVIIEKNGPYPALEWPSLGEGLTCQITNDVMSDCRNQAYKVCD